jgi:hypothetical protein
MSWTRQSGVWRVLSRSLKAAGDIEGYERAARTAAMIEKRPWKRDRPTHSRPAPEHSQKISRHWY